MGSEDVDVEATVAAAVAEIKDVCLIAGNKAAINRIFLFYSIESSSII